MKQNEALSARAESTLKGVNQRSKAVTQTPQQHRSDSPTVTLTWHASRYKVHKLHQRYLTCSTGASDGVSVACIYLFIPMYFIVYCDVVYVQPRFNLSDEIIKSC